ncbi:MAG TPA: hypothetical protein VFQ38_21280 [Longimicrobiales bacterium]|nr:hypothetical protein [Longimicrobiales bacterium]
MTHTLHRYGTREDLGDDYIVFAMPARGLNDADAVEKQRAFLRCALHHHPVNIGDSKKGGAYRPDEALTPRAHWKREAGPHPETVIDGVDSAGLVSAVFDNYAAVEAFVRELVQLNLGLSINISSLASRAEACCHACGLVRHSAEYSLGFLGRTEKLPEEAVLRLTTMCGHGMVSPGLARKMLDWVRAGRRTPEQASAYLARFCVCGVFNPARAARLLAGRAAPVSEAVRSDAPAHA